MGRTKFFQTQNRILFLISRLHLQKPQVIRRLCVWYGACALLSWKQRECEKEEDMKKSNAIISISLLAGALIIPSVGAYADPNPPGNSRQREELRRDQRQLEQLRQRRDQELREGDRREAREYNEKIRDQQREIRQDRRAIYGDRYGWNRDDWRRNRDHDYDHYRD